MSGMDVEKVTKRFGNVNALRDVSVHFDPNKVYGLLGSNSAGKSTLLNVIAGRIFANEGAVRMDGVPVPENDSALRNIFLMSETNLYPGNMKIHRALKWTAKFYPDFDEAYANRLAAEFKIDPNKKIKSLSTGTRTIFKIIAALASNAAYLLLDEPTLGLDAENREIFYQAIIRKCTENPCTIIIATHLIEEASVIFDHVVIVKDGRIIRDESCEELLRKGREITGSASAVEQFIQDKTVLGVESFGGQKTAYCLGEFNSLSVPEGLRVSGMNLQKLFIRMVHSQEEGI